ncbi:cache domain-containing protein [Microbacterium sp. 179-B 1A2 NHS]|uniref:cache domain-containing protein n=1 Tax=Microbacterium sp. 179-B 1A2 NHS TaxID=3142383 RepID=UPI0039A3155F
MTTTTNAASASDAVLDADAAVDAAAAAATAYFDAILPSLEQHAERIAEAIRTAGSEGLTAARIDELVEPHAFSVLDHADEPVYGAGFIATVDLLTDTASHLAWWQGAERRKLVFPAESVKQGIDYRELDWFRIPMTTGRPHVAGPYVDYLCSDEYTMTAAWPVRIDGAFVGVAGLDVLIDTIERRLTPPLRALGVPLLLVNGVNRVLVSTDVRFSAGDVLRPDRVEILDRRASERVDLAIVRVA